MIAIKSIIREYLPSVMMGLLQGAVIVAAVYAGLEAIKVLHI